MQSKLIYFLLFLPVFMFSQTPEHSNSLLWEISGNNLKKPSYLYGTMHVSNKIAFRLDDIFYEALDKAEIVALESDPNLWLDYYIKNDNAIDFTNLYNNDFYKSSFVPEAPKLPQVTAMLGLDAQMLNNVLYRTSIYTENFEEETYLDMFIYQACRKFNKKFVPLEDIEESDKLVKRSQNHMTKEEPDAWLIKRLQKDTYYNLLQNAYRERNINFIDSLQTAYYTPEHLKYMLYERNKIMADGINKTVQKGSTFIGIGAAHLAGENGVIHLLTKMGYTVKPLQSDKTKAAKNLKEKFEDTFTIRPYERDSMENGFLSVELPNKLYNFGSFAGIGFYASPDLTNGAYFSAIRVSTFPYLNNEEKLTLETLEDMFFEAIPGTIITKKKLNNNGYEGVDIVNKLKNGDYQRYQIYQTPLEILILKLGGKKQFALDYGDLIFKTVKFGGHTTTKWQTVHNFDNNFSVDLPAEHIFYNSKKSGKKLIQAYDPATEAWYLMERNTLNDLEYIEEDDFELKYIQKQFYESMEATPDYNGFTKYNQMPVLTSAAVKDTINNTGKIQVKTTLDKGNYYLMATFGATDTDTERFFNSLKINDIVYEIPYETVKDTALYFSTVTNVKPSPNNQYAGLYGPYLNRNNKKKDYEEYQKSITYKNNSDEKIEVTLYKLHDYDMYENVDSLWNNHYYKSFQYQTFIKQPLSHTPLKDNMASQELLLKDTLSNRAIYLKSIVKNGTIYELKTLTDTLQKPSRFITEFYNNFKPNDTVIGVSPFEDKTALFFKKLRENDSLVQTSVFRLTFSEKHLDSLMKFVSDFEFPEDKLFIKNAFLRKIARMDDKRVKPFLKKLYESSYDDSNIQEFILNAIADKEDEGSVKDILDLLSADFPVGVSRFEFINSFSDSLPVAKKFYPDLLDYTSIEEYKIPVYGLLAQLVLKKEVNPKMYKGIVGQLLNEAKIELKKMLSNNHTPLYPPHHDYDSYGGYNDEYYDDDEDYDDGYYGEQDLLSTYVTLLYPYKNTKKVSEFLNRLQLAKDDEFKINYLIIKKLFGEKVTSEDFLPFAENSKTRSDLFLALTTTELMNLYPKPYLSQDSLNVATFYRFNDYNKATNYHNFINQYKVTNKQGTFDVYLYKLTAKNTYNNEENVTLKALCIKEGGEIVPFPAFVINQKYNKYDPEQEQVQKILDEIELKGRERVNTDNDNNYNDYLYDNGY